MKAGLAEQAAGWNEATRRLNAHLLGNVTPDIPSPVKVAQNGLESPKKRMRQSRDKLNKLETAYLAFLVENNPKCTVFCQAIRLKLGNGIWYKPDFYIPEDLLFIEVKGPKAFRGGFENLKVAAGIHKWASFRLVWRESGVWQSQEVLP